eukprot:jgi/Chlat1/2179/Chrsp17S02745
MLGAVGSGVRLARCCLHVVTAPNICGAYPVGLRKGFRCHPPISTGAAAPSCRMVEASSVKRSRDDDGQLGEDPTAGDKRRRTLTRTRQTTLSGFVSASAEKTNNNNNNKPESVSSPLCKPIQLSPTMSIDYYPRLLDPAYADSCIAKLDQEVNWQRRKVRVHGKIHESPRLVSLQGDKGVAYEYSGQQVESEPWTPTVLALKAIVEGVTGVTYNAALLNRYNDGNDSIARHADLEKSMGVHVAGLSLGAVRDFILRAKADPVKCKTVLPLASGSLLIMPRALHQTWTHEIPRRKGCSSVRISLTFRIFLGATN